MHCGLRMSEGTVRQWFKMFKDGQTNVHDEEQSGRPSVVNDYIVMHMGDL
jgi:transposase